MVEVDLDNVTRNAFYDEALCIYSRQRRKIRNSDGYVRCNLVESAIAKVKTSRISGQNFVG